MNPELPKKGGICVSIAADHNNRIESTVTAAQIAADKADVVEIRLDTLPEIKIEPFISNLTTPLLFTNRAKWEGGQFQGSEEGRLQPLFDATNAQAAYIDLELKAESALRNRLLEMTKISPTRMIISWHNFDQTPATESLVDILQQQYESGADIGKIVTMAHNESDVLRVLQLQTLAAEKNFPLIAFCMGEAGMISRVATLQLGGYMTYAAADSGQVTAPGQLPVTELRTMLTRLGYDN